MSWENDYNYGRNTGDYSNYNNGVYEQDHSYKESFPSDSYNNNTGWTGVDKGSGGFGGSFSIGGGGRLLAGILSSGFGTFVDIAKETAQEFWC